jgi:hypothetical protein
MTVDTMMPPKSVWKIVKFIEIEHEEWGGRPCAPRFPSTREFQGVYS